MPPRGVQAIVGPALSPDSSQASNVAVAVLPEKGKRSRSVETASKPSKGVHRTESTAGGIATAANETSNSAEAVPPPLETMASKVPAALLAHPVLAGGNAAVARAILRKRAEAIGAHLSGRPRVKAADIVALDTSVHERAKALLASSRTVASASAEDLHAWLADVMNWKLNLGQFRPGLLQQVQKNKPDDVKTALQRSLEALEAPGSTKAIAITTNNTKNHAGSASQVSLTVATPEGVVAAMKPLTDAIGGVGPATASAVLSLSGEGLVPFMADEAMRAVFGATNALKYDVSTLKKFTESIQAVQCHMMLRQSANNSSSKTDNPAPLSAAEVASALVLQDWLIKKK